MVADPLAGGELLEQGAVEATRGMRKSTSSMMAALAQLAPRAAGGRGACSRGWSPRGRPAGRASPRGSARRPRRVLHLDEGVGHGREAEARAGARPWGGSASVLLSRSVVVAGTADVLVDQDWAPRPRRRARSRDGSSGWRRPSCRSGCRAPAPGRRRRRRAPRRSASDQAEDADAGAEALLGMRPRAQDDVDQGGGVVADRGGLAADPLMRPVAIAPVRARHVLRHRGRPMPAQAAQMDGDPLAAMEDLDGLRR